MSSGRRRDLLALAALSAGWLLALGVIGVHGAFPLNDDWSYARTVQTLLETGRFERPAWTWAPSVTNVAIGALFAGARGFSHEALRASGVFCGWLGLLAVYGLGRQLGLGAAAAGATAALLGFNPVHLSLSYTFMTDVPFAAMTTASLACLARGLPGLAWRPLAAGVALAVAATLSRQVGLALALALGAAMVASQLRHPRRVLVGLALAGAVIVAYELSPLLFGAGDSGRRFTLVWFVRHSLLGPDAAWFLFRNGLTVWAYLGLLLAPLVVVVAPRGRAGLRLAVGAAAGAALGLGAIAWRGLQMPLGQNAIVDLGIGPRTLSGADALPHAPAALWWATAALAFAAGTALALRLGADLWWRRHRLLHEPERIVLLLFVVLYLGPLLVRWPFFDRWLLPVLPPLAVLLATAGPGAPRPLRDAGRAHLAVAALLTALLVLFGVVGTRDYLEHHRARWRLLDGLLARSVSPARVDGGFEFNGWFNFDRDESRFLPGRVSRWVLDDEFLVSTAPEPPGYRAVESVTFHRWLPPGTERLTLFERVEGGSVAPAQERATQDHAEGQGGQQGGGQHGAP